LPNLGRNLNKLILMNDQVVLPLYYLPPLSYYTTLFKSEGRVLIEIHEHYERQTFRNRCEISTPHGRHALIVPVHKAPGKVMTKEVEIAYEERWQQRHWRTICNYYRKSAYFEYYEDTFKQLYAASHPYKYLVDWNKALFDLTLKILKTPTNYHFTEKFEIRSQKSEVRSPTSDLRSSYFQVYSHQTGFLEDLSIIDLIFNMGPGSIEFLR
jgi:hypothetical protein